jgi:hypothetical protein
MLFGRKPSVLGGAEHEDDPDQRRAKAHTGAEKLHDIHGAIYPEIRCLRHTIKPCETD